MLVFFKRKVDGLAGEWDGKLIFFACSYHQLNSDCNQRKPLHQTLAYRGPNLRFVVEVISKPLLPKLSRKSKIENQKLKIENRKPKIVVTQILIFSLI